MDHPILFAPAKQGGILQSSGFLDLESLMALSLTCKANAYDEQSLILFIEHEITLDHHHIRTREEAIRCLVPVIHRFQGWFRYDWFGRDMAHDAAQLGLFVMFSKMLRKADWPLVNRIMTFSLEGSSHTVLRYVAEAKPESIRLVLHALSKSQHLLFVTIKDRYGKTVLDYATSKSLPIFLSIGRESQNLHVQDAQGMTALHHAALSDIETMEMLLALYPEPERVETVRRQDRAGMTALHHASSNCLESIQLILSIYPESERLTALCRQDEKGRTALHYAADSYNTTSVQFLLTQLPESHRLQVVSMQDRDGDTALHLAAHSSNLSDFRVILDSLAESERSPVFVIRSGNSETALHYVAKLGYSESLPAVLELIPESERLQFMCMQDDKGLTPLHKCIFTNSCDLRIVKALLGWIPASQRLQVVSVQDQDGETALHRAICSNNYEVFQEILELLPESERIQALMIRNGNNETALHCAARSGVNSADSLASSGTGACEL